jgi:hypothetical protein
MTTETERTALVERHVLALMDDGSPSGPDECRYVTLAMARSAIAAAVTEALASAPSAQPSEAELERLRTLLRQAAVATGEQLGDWDDLPTVIARLKASAPSGFDLIAHLTRQRAFSERTFGPGPRAMGVLAHIRKELREIEDDPTNLVEWIDVILLAFDGAWRAGHSPAAIAEVLDAKQTKNEARDWPDWRTLPADVPIEHRCDADPIAAAVDAQLDPLKDELIAMGRNLAGMAVETTPKRHWTTRLYRCRSCGYEMNVQATEHRPMMCDRTNCGGTTEPKR